MGTDAVVEDEIFSESQSKEPKIMDNIKILGNELILDSSVITLYAAIDLWVYAFTTYETNKGVCGRREGACCSKTFTDSIGRPA
jgi:hypothetical protein